MMTVHASARDEKIQNAGGIAHPFCRAQVSRKEHISLAPEFFGGDIKDRLFTLLKNKIEGKYHGVWGYTVFVVCECFDDV